MLTPAEKQAGRFFRGVEQVTLDRLNELSPPHIVVPLFCGKHYRHECIARDGRSTSFEVYEIYHYCPELWICYCSAIGQLVPGSFPHRDCDGGKLILGSRRLGFIYREGKCVCGLVARSADGRVVDAQARPPIGRKVTGG